MAIEDIALRLKLSATGVQEQVDNSQQIANNYARATANAEKLGAANARAAAYSGSRSTRETVEYGMARGAAGSTGASARDFANQAQGLGGLVRLYATYAANIFAVEAAFRALNEAAKTEQMVRGLDQLGGASGRALGALSKQLVNVTDGAISMRDAMTAVAQTSAAGMSSQNILKLGAAAQKASQVLGLNMTDAINRLSRGITKLEPELLDELGVFVRIDDAAEQYARTLGKTTSSLTEFERRTGFAVAVLKQLDEKFGTIDLDTNPYDKLAASLANLTTAGLEFVNKFLKPVVDFLAQSPAALAGGIAALLSLVVKQALPVVGMYKEYLSKMREQSLAQVAQTSQAYSSAIIKNRQLAVRAAEAEAEARSAAIDKAEERLSAIRQSKFVQEKARVMEILTKPTQLITQDDLNYLQKQADKNAKTNADLAKSYVEVKDTIQASKKAEGDYAIASKSLAEAKLLASQQVVGNYKNELKFKELSRKATIDETVANVNRYAKETNFLSAIYKGLSEINVKAKEYTQLIPKLDQKGKPTGEFESITMTKNFSTTEKLMAGTRVVTAGLASGLEKLISTAGTLGLAIGAISGVIALLKSAFTDNAKETKDYEQSLVNLQGAAKAAEETLRSLSKQQSGKFLSPESILARAQAIYNLSEALDDTVAKAGLYNATLNDFGAGLNKLDQIFGEGAKRAGEAFRKNVGGLTGALVGGGLEGFGRLFQGIFGTDKITELSNGLAEAVNKTYKLARNAQERSQIESLAKQIYGSEADISNLDMLKKYLLGFSFEEVNARAEQFANGIRKIAKEAMDSATALMSFKDSIKVLSKDIADLNTSLIPTDRLAKVGIDAMQSSGLMTKALTNVENTISSVHTVLNDFNTLSLFPEGFVQNIAQTRQEINDTVDQLGAVKAAVEQTQLKIADPKVKQVDKQAFQEQLKVLQDQEAKLTEKAVTLTARLAPRISEQLFIAGASKIEASFKFAMERASIAGAKAYLDVIKAAGGYTAQREAQLAQADIALQRKMIEVQYQSYVQAQKNQLAVEENTNQLAMNALAEKVKQQGGYATGDTERLGQLVKERQVLTMQRNWLEGPVKSFKELEKIRKEGDDLSQEALRRSGQYYAVIAGREAQLADANAQSARVELNRQRNLAIEAATQEERRLDVGINARKIDIDRNNLNQSLLGIYDDQLAAQQLNLENLQREDQYKKSIAKTSAEITFLEKLRKERPGEFTDKDNLRLQELLNSRADAYNQKEAENQAATKRFSIDRVKKLEEFNQKERDHVSQMQSVYNEINSSRLSFQEQYLNYLSAFDAVDKTALINQRSNLELRKQEAEYSSKILENSLRQQAVAARETERAAQLLANPQVDLTQFDKETARQQALLEAQRISIQQANDARVYGIELQRKQNVELERQNYFLEQAGKISTTLNESFGKTGERLGQAVDGYAKVAINLENSKRRQDEFNKETERQIQLAAQGADNSEYWANWAENKDKQDKRSAQDELDRNAMALSSTKKLFKEKTAAYRAFGALEKAYHVARLIMSAKEIATTIANTVSFVTGSITRQTAAATEAGVLGVKAVINAISTMPFPLNLAAGAATTAVVAGLLGSIGKVFKGSSGGSSTGPSVADVVKVQGTGQEYDASGKLVNTGTGVYGDPTAVADSVKSSMDTLSKNFFGLLGSGNSPVVKALKSIETNTGETVKALIGEGISGFAGNTMSRFGTKVGTESTTAWYNLWSGSTTKTEILAAGFELKGTFDQVSKIAVDGLNNLGQSTSGAAIRLFEDIKTTTKGKFLGVTIPFTKDVDYDTKFTAATQALVKAVTGTVTSVGNAIVAAAEAIDGSGQQAQTILKNFDFGIRLVTTGLTAEEALQKLTGEISKKLNALTLAVTPWITEFVQNGEEYFETAARIAKGSEVVRDGLYILGETLGTFGTTVERVRVEQKLIEAAGGLEEFASAVTYFEERFLTEQERVALKQTRLVEQLTNGNKDLAKNLGLSKQVFEQLGFGAVDSTYELKALIQSFQVTDDASALLKAELLKLAPAMYEVYSEVEKFNIQLGVENIKLASTLTPLQQSLREILTTASTELEKYRDNGANLLSVVNNVRLKFLSAIKSSFKSAYDDRQKEITGTLDALKRVKESFTSLQKELLRGAQSTSTPVEKFNILFSEYKQALVDIQSTDTKVSDAAKQAFPNLAKEVLQSASELYSSSEMYTKIFDQVSRDVGSASDFIDQQISDQEKLLNELDSKYKPILDDISVNTKTSADKLEEAYDLWNRSLGSKQTLTAADIQTFVNALKDKNTPAVKALADFFKLTDPGTAALAISVEALAVDFEQFARGLVEAAKTSMGELGANSLTAIRAAAVANKPADGGDGGNGGRGGDGGNGGIITIGPDGKVTSTIVGETGDTGRSGEAGSTGGTTSSTTSTLLAGELDPAFVADEYGTGGEAITLGDRTGGATIGEDILRGREVDSVAAQASQALQDYEDMLTDYGTLGMNTDQLESVSSLLTDEGLGGILTSGNLNDTAEITLGTNRYNEFSNTNDVNAGFGANVSEFGDGVIGASEAINQASTALTTASNNLTTAANATLVDNAASLATMMVLNEANTALTVTNSLGLQTASQLVSAGTELVLSAIQAGQELMNNFSSQSIPYASFWRSGGVDYGKNWDEWNDWNDGLSGRASGGPVTANTPYMVGEVGPELFVPSTNGTIVPNNELSFNNQEIVAKLDQLIQAVSQGAVINVRATKENTECIEQAIMNNNNTIRAQSRVGIK